MGTKVLEFFELFEYLMSEYVANRKNGYCKCQVREIRTEWKNFTLVVIIRFEIIPIYAIYIVNIYRFLPNTGAYINIRNDRINIIYGSIRLDGEPFLRCHDSSSLCNNTVWRSNTSYNYGTDPITWLENK